MQDPLLWSRIMSFEFDDPEALSPFSIRLQREHNWTYTHTLQAIEEYRKFMYLAVISVKGVSPSEDIDLVWHFHLLYTRSYWEDFCPNVLQQKIHHGPTKGGEKELSCHNQLYGHTLSLYAIEFEKKAPELIWVSIEQRFLATTIKKKDTKQFDVFPENILKWIKLRFLL